MLIENNELIAVSLKTLIDLARPARVLKLQSVGIRAKQSGSHVSRFKNRGMEFNEVRLYQIGDDIRNIDWRATAHTGKVYTKLFREERERPVFISVDYRATMHFATRGVFKSVLAAKLAGLLAWTAHHHGDRIGGQLFSDNHCYELKPQNGKSAVLHFLNTLCKDNNIATINDDISLEQVFKRLNRHAHAGSLIYIISDFRGFNAHAEKQLIKLMQHCSLVLIFIYDPLEKKLPTKGIYRFTDKGRDVVIDSQDTKRITHYQQRFEERVQQLKQFSKSHGIVLLQCNTLDEPVQCLR